MSYGPSVKINHAVHELTMLHLALFAMHPCMLNIRLVFRTIANPAAAYVPILFKGIRSLPIHQIPEFVV